MQSDKKSYYKLKFIIIGDAGVGKTNLVHRFVKGEFKSEYHLTLGMDFSSYNLEIDGKLFTLQLWDTAGSEKFRSIAKGYYINSVCAIVVYDITDEQSFKSISNWINDCENYANKNIIKILVGNKSDLNDQRKISQEDGRDMATNNRMLFYECSALNGNNVENIFFDACKTISKNMDDGKYDTECEDLGLQRCDVSASTDFKINKKLSLKPDEKNKKKCC